MRRIILAAIAVMSVFVIIGSPAASSAPALPLVSASAVTTSVPVADVISNVPEALPAAIPAPDLYTCYASKVVLRVGSHGGCVKVVQVYLNRWGVYNWHGKRLVVDGKFGARTATEVARAQGAFGIPPDRKVGPRTWGAFLQGPM